MEILLTVAIMIACLASEAFFSGSEIAVVSADRMKLRHEAAAGSRGAKLALDMLKRPEWLLSTTLVGTNISVVANTTMATALAIALFGESRSWMAIIIVTPLIWIFGEIVSKSVFQQRADTITPKAIFVLKGASYLFWPILIVFSVLTRAVTKFVGSGDLRNPFTLREEIATMIEMSAADGDILPMERVMIRRVFNFGETTAADIMVPMANVIAIGRDATCGKARHLAVEHAHKRLPVYGERLDQIVGTLNALHLLRADPDAPIAQFVRDAHFVPGSISVQTLLEDLRQGAHKMAVIVDEFGTASGIVMLEDILELVVGEIEDEFDAPDVPGARIRKLAERDYVVSARILIDALNEEIEISLPHGGYHTLGGFLIQLADAIPPAGSVLQYEDLSFTIETASPQAIEKVRIRW